MKRVVPAFNGCPLASLALPSLMLEVAVHNSLLPLLCGQLIYQAGPTAALLAKQDSDQEN